MYACILQFMVDILHISNMDHTVLFSPVINIGFLKAYQHVTGCGC